MKPTLTKAFLVALPLASLLFTAPAAFAEYHRHHHCWSNHGDHSSYSHRWQEGRRYQGDDDNDRRPAPRYGQRYHDDDYDRGSYAPQSSPSYSPWGRGFLAR
jgi:hypothetical protein